MKTGNQISHITGQTKSVGFEFGLRRTFNMDLRDAWQYLISPNGIKMWLGDIHNFRLEKGHTYQSADGASGEVRVVNPEVNIRLTWQPGGWPKPSTIQVRVSPAGNKTTISFHQENLPDAKAREDMRQRWEKVMTAITRQLAG